MFFDNFLRLRILDIVYIFQFFLINFLSSLLPKITINCSYLQDIIGIRVGQAFYPQS